MKILTILVGAVVLLLSIILLLVEQKLLPSFLSFMPGTSLFYHICLMILGAILVYYGIKKKDAA